MNTTTTGATANYLAQVKAELGDLPATELDEVLEDVADHLEEIGAELDGEPTPEALEARLGSPREYAEELRTAAGYPPKTPAGGGRNPGAVALRWGIVATLLTPFLVLVSVGVGAVTSPTVLLWIAIGLVPAILGVRALRGHNPSIVRTAPLWQRGEAFVRRRADALPESLRRDLAGIGQPVWWVLRGALGGIALYTVFSGDANPFAFAIVAVLGALLSIWMGRRSQDDRRWLWYLVPMNAVTALALLALPLGAGFWSTSAYGYGYDSVYRGDSVDASGLWLDGSQVTNLFPYDRDGKPLQDVRLYDQLGRPLEVPAECVNLPSDKPAPFVLDNLWPKSMTLLDGATCAAAVPPSRTLPPLPSASPTKPVPTPTR